MTTTTAQNTHSASDPPWAIATRSLWLTAAVALSLTLPGCHKTETAVPTQASSAAGVSAAPAAAVAKTAGKAATVRVEIVKSAPWVLRFAVTGTVEATRIAQLSSMAEGPVLGIRVREGDLVKRGQVLLTLGRTEAVSGNFQASCRLSVAFMPLF